VRSPSRSQFPPPAASRGRRGGKQGRSIMASTQSLPSLGLVDSFHVAPPEQARGYSASACHDRCACEQNPPSPWRAEGGASGTAHRAQASVPAGAYPVRRGCAHGRAQGSRAGCNTRRVQQTEAMKPLVQSKGLPNPGFDRSAKQLRCLVPSSLRSSAPGQPERWASPDTPRLD
jgi:hypothetical protein